MAFFNDGAVDMASLFQPTSEFLQSAQDGADVRPYGASSPLGQANGGANEDESKAMMRLVPSP